jgi:UrcA family protein
MPRFSNRALLCTAAALACASFAPQGLTRLQQEDPLTRMTVNARVPDDGRLTRVVHFGDLNLSNPLGIDALYGRIEAAAAYVCAPLNGKDLRSTNEYGKCYDKAVTNAVTSVNQSRLAALHKERSLRPKG